MIWVLIRGGESPHLVAAMAKAAAMMVEKCILSGGGLKNDARLGFWGE